MNIAGEPFMQFVWRSCLHPIRAFGGSPLAQSAAAFAINVWFLWIAVLGQFWVILSAAILFAQLHNTWQVYSQRRGRLVALIIGMGFVALNYFALTLAVLGQFWVIGSVVLATWQFVSLVRACVGAGVVLPSSTQAGESPFRKGATS